MQVVFETIFDIIYLFGVVITGFIMIKTSEKGDTRMLFGFMAVILGLGDAFHLIPRMYSLWTTGLEANAQFLGFGKLATSITMTVFYVILYYIWRKHYKIKDGKNLTIAIWSLAIARIILCAFPQNQWFVYKQPLDFGIYRNIPFAIMGIIIIILFSRKVKEHNDKAFKYMPLAISLSFIFYIPVVLFGGIFPLVGMLMIPKTLAYVWIVVMGYNLSKESQIKTTVKSL